MQNLAPIVCITLGNKGLIWSNRDTSEKRQLSAFQIKSLDTTGAGDIFHGAFTASVARNLGLKESLIHASAAAAIGCLKLGARPAIPTREQVLNFLNVQPPLLDSPLTPV